MMPEFDSLHARRGASTRALFAAEVVRVADALVPATLALWKRVAARMLPTPAKFHYLFNMRELSKVRRSFLEHSWSCTSSLPGRQLGYARCRLHAIGSPGDLWCWFRKITSFGIAQG